MYDAITCKSYSNSIVRIKMQHFFALGNTDKFMNKLLALVLSGACSLGSISVFAATEYNSPPAGSAQFSSCISYANKTYEGGTAASPVPGQSKARAFCTCMWNETPEDFKGDLVKFSETAKGKETNEICEKHSNWGN